MYTLTPTMYPQIKALERWHELRNKFESYPVVDGFRPQLKQIPKAELEEFTSILEPYWKDMAPVVRMVKRKTGEEYKELAFDVAIGAMEGV